MGAQAFKAFGGGGDDSDAGDGSGRKQPRAVLGGPRGQVDTVQSTLEVLEQIESELVADEMEDGEGSPPETDTLLGDGEDDDDGIDPTDPLHASGPGQQGKGARIVAYDWAKGFVSPYRPVKDDVLELLLFHLSKMDKFANTTRPHLLYDLGCGDGRIVCKAAKKLDVFSVGVELDGALARQSRDLARTMGVDHLVDIVEKDLLTVDLTQATVIVMYLLPEAIQKFTNVLQEAYDRGCIIMSVMWPIDGWDAQLCPSVSRAECVSLDFYVYTRP